MCSRKEETALYIELTMVQTTCNYVFFMFFISISRILEFCAFRWYYKKGFRSFWCKRLHLCFSIWLDRYRGFRQDRVLDVVILRWHANLSVALRDKSVTLVVSLKATYFFQFIRNLNNLCRTSKLSTIIWPRCFHLITTFTSLMIQLLLNFTSLTTSLPPPLKTQTLSFAAMPSIAASMNSIITARQHILAKRWKIKTPSTTGVWELPRLEEEKHLAMSSSKAVPVISKEHWNLILHVPSVYLGLSPRKTNSLAISNSSHTVLLLEQKGLLSPSLEKWKVRTQRSCSRSTNRVFYKHIECWGQWKSSQITIRKSLKPVTVWKRTVYMCRIRRVPAWARVRSCSEWQTHRTTQRTWSNQRARAASVHIIHPHCSSLGSWCNNKSTSPKTAGKKQRRRV